jgi:hypothetical protein
MRQIGVKPIIKTKVRMSSQKTPSEQYSISGVVLRLTGADVKNAAEGEYTTEDIKIYYEPDPAKPVLKGYEINVNDGEVYKVKNIKPREEGNFKIAICKKQ